MPSFKQELEQYIQGEVYFDSITRHVYSVDASIFEVLPLGVVIPKDQNDLVKAIQIAYAHRVSIIPRGAATGITGGCLGQGIIIDMSKSLNRILHIDIEHEYIECEAGVVQDELNAALAPYKYRLGPDTSTGNRATLGGMLANNAAGSRSLRYGKMVDHVLAVNLVLANGKTLHFKEMTQEEWQSKMNDQGDEGRIYLALWHIKDTYRNDILKQFPKIPRRVSGYNLDTLVNTDSINPAKLIVGSEGTLGVVASMKLKIVPIAKASGLCILHFNDMHEAFRAAPQILQYDPMALEMIDDQIIELGRASPSLRGQLDWLQGRPKALLIIEIDGSNALEVEKKLQTFKQEMHRQHIGMAQHILTDPSAISKVWALRKAGLGILLSKRTYSRAIAFLEDISISPHQLAPFMEQFCTYLESKGKSSGIYGHVGSGCMHIRPHINLQQPEDIQFMRKMMLDISDLILKFGGALSGEHGDGLIRSWLNPKMFGEQIMEAFETLKNAFDPDNLMNPSKIVNSHEIRTEELRLSPERHLKGPKTFLDFTPEGGFELAVDLCNGNGQCRKKTGVMCPSFQVTNDEFHSTRARAQTLRDIVQGRIPLEDFTSPGMHAVMDLCISCKGCKTECPSQIDMAKMKAEFLYHYQEKHGYSLRSYLFGYIGRINWWTSHFASLFNWAQQSWVAKKGMGWIGITPHRNLPKLARQTFSKWLSQFSQPKQLSKQVVLFNDTFTEFNEPEIGQAAVHILNALGYTVIVPQWNCCGRPFISKGLLKQGRAHAEKVLKTLMPYVKQNLPIIGLEPSCILTLKDDYLTLLTDTYQNEAQALAKACVTWDEFLSQHIQNGTLPLKFKTNECLVKVHGHCHQKALVGMQPTLKVLRSIPGFIVEEIDSGCCGMAGSFGYEKEHYLTSMEIGNLKLFPAIKNTSEEMLLIANGTSCRHQIDDGTNRRAQHLAEALFSHLQIE